MKKVKDVYNQPQSHWVGDGFPVKTLFSYHSNAEQFSPFLLLDYAGPYEFTSAPSPRGVGQHPHRGFETVTIVYSGEVEHRDSTGQGGIIGPGDVQWMTAGSGIIHEEFHSPAFTRSGGLFQVIQLWVNLPTKHKMAQPHYQSILDQDIPTVSLPDGAGVMRVIAGEFDGHQGPAHSFTPINVWDLRLKSGGDKKLSLPAGWTTAIVVLSGNVQINNEVIAPEKHVVLLDRDGQDFSIQANSDAVLLIISGEPIDEPIAGHGPFVMNTDQEILQAIDDYKNGRFGGLS